MLNHAAYLHSFSRMKNSSSRKLNPDDWILSRAIYRQPDSQPHRHAVINPRRAEHILQKSHKRNMYKTLNNPNRYTCPFTPNTQVTFYLQLLNRFKAKKKRKNTNSNAYRQRFGNSYLDLAELGPLQSLDSILQAGVLQVGGVNIHESVSWQQSAILLGHTTGNQRANHDHRLGGVQWVLWRSRSSKVQ